MDLETVYSCPLGSKCREIKDNKLHQCVWYINLQGHDPQTGKIIDDYKCSMAYIPIMLVETANASRSTSKALEDLRNQMYLTMLENDNLLT